MNAHVCIDLQTGNVIHPAENHLVAFETRFPATDGDLIEKYPAFKKLLSISGVGRPIPKDVNPLNSDLWPSMEPVMVDPYPPVLAGETGANPDPRLGSRSPTDFPPMSRNITCLRGRNARKVPRQM